MFSCPRSLSSKLENNPTQEIYQYSIEFAIKFFTLLLWAFYTESTCKEIRCAGEMAFPDHQGDNELLATIVVRKVIWNTGAPF